MKNVLCFFTNYIKLIFVFNEYFFFMMICDVSCPSHHPLVDRVYEDKESTCEIVKIEIKECQNKINEKGVDAITGMELNNIVTLNEDDKGIVIVG